ncbi:MAG: hypothetical protein IPP33_18475 [Flavobacteriales bacterium]|nr:hypothetical protein [Flavobacteriales bacterium]
MNLRSLMAAITLTCSAITASAQDSWQSVADFGGGERIGAVSFTIGDTIYAGAGLTSPSLYLNDFWKFHPSTGWTPIAPFPGVGRSNAVAFTIGGKGYVGAGRIMNPPVANDGDLTTDFYAYDPSTGQWETVPDFSYRMAGGVAFTIADSAYVGLGICGSGCTTTSIVMYHPSTGWVYRQPFPGEPMGRFRFFASAFQMGGKGYVFGGSAGYSDHTPNSLWEFDGSTWTEKSALPAAGRYGAAAFNIGSSGFIVGGYAHDNSELADVWQYDQVSDTWIQRSSMLGGSRGFASACTLNNEAYVGTGRLAGFVSTATYEKYTPLPFDCTYTPGGSAFPGDPCDDGNALTINDAYSIACTCEGTPVPCILGDPCDDGSTFTVNDVYDADCLCTGTYQNGDDWSQELDFGGTPRAYAVSFSIGDKGYVGTGSNGAALADFWEFDPLTHAWSQKADFGGGPRERATGFVIGAKGYIGTGLTGINTNHDDFWGYDRTSNAWTEKAAFPGGIRQFAVGFSVGPKGYLGLGTASTLYPEDMYAYDPAADSWTPISNMNFGVGRAGAVAFSIGNIGYVGGGQYSGSLIDQFHAYYPSTDSWSSIASFPQSDRVGMVGMSIGNSGYVGTGGGINSAVFNDFWRYDPVMNQWSQRASMPASSRFSGFSFSIGNAGYVGSGDASFGGNYLSDFWKYSPPVDCTGTSEGPAVPGNVCDDGDACTTNDQVDVNCTCTGTRAPTSTRTASAMRRIPARTTRARDRAVRSRIHRCSCYHRSAARLQDATATTTSMAQRPAMPAPNTVWTVTTASPRATAPPRSPCSSATSSTLRRPWPCTCWM